jgi:hypothetical protein
MLTTSITTIPLNFDSDESYVNTFLKFAEREQDEASKRVSNF